MRACLEGRLGIGPVGIGIGRDAHRVRPGLREGFVVITEFRITPTQFLVELPARFRRAGHNSHDLERVELVISPRMRTSHVTGTDTEDTDLVTHWVAGTVA